MELECQQSIKKYIIQQGKNYSKVLNIKFLAAGGESTVMRLEVEEPIEVVAKLANPPEDKNDKQRVTGILMESHLIKLLTNKEHVVDIFEEIIEIDMKDT